MTNYVEDYLAYGLLPGLGYLALLAGRILCRPVLGGLHHMSGFVAATATTSAALVAAPYVRGAYAAGKLSIGFWDHWVPGANKTLTDLVNEWAEKAKVEVRIDYITS